MHTWWGEESSVIPHLLTRPLFPKPSLHIPMQLNKTTPLKTTFSETFPSHRYENEEYHPSLKTTFSKTLFKSLCKQIRLTVSLRLPFFFRNPPFTSSCKNLTKITPLLRPLFHNPLHSCFHENEPLTRNHTFLTFYLTLMCGLKMSPHPPPPPPHTHTPCISTC